MKRKNIYLLTGEINSGKTTELTEWIKSKANCSGILQPKIENRRYLLDIETNKIKPLDASALTPADKIVKVGKYNFDRTTFDWAKKILRENPNNNPEWIIIDEFGKLELMNKGLEPAVSQLIKLASDSEKFKLLIVIRNYLAQQFLNKFDAHKNRIKIISKEELKTL